MRSDVPAHQDPEERALPPLAWDGASLLVGVLFALLNEGNGFRSKAVGHFICSQGDPKDILMVAVVILGDRNRKQPSEASPGHREGRHTDTQYELSLKKTGPKETRRFSAPGRALGL